MPAWHLTIDTPLALRNVTIRGTDLKTKEDAIASYQNRQSLKGYNGNPLGHQGEIIDCIPAVYPDHFKNRPRELDALHPTPLGPKELLK